MAAKEEVHYVYLFARVDDNRLMRPVKVGITKSLLSRLATVQTGSPYKIEIAHAFALPMRYLALAVEQTFHETEAEHRLQGEWFDMSPYDALWTLTDIVKDLVQEFMNHGLGSKEAENFSHNSGLLDAMRFIMERENAKKQSGGSE